MVEPMLTSIHSTSPPSFNNSISILDPAPSVIGMASKKEKRAASYRERPRSIPPAKVAPERDIPGIKARAWYKPIKRPFFIVSTPCAGLR